MWTKTLLALVFPLFMIFNSLPSEAPKAVEHKWTLGKEKDGIKVYSRPPLEGNLNDTKAICKMKAGVFDVIGLFREFHNYPAWMNRCVVSELLERVSYKEYYVYMKTDLPWPMSDRDVIIHIDGEEKEDGTVLLNMIGKPDFIPHKKGIVRIPLLEGYWTIKPAAGDSVEVSYQVKNDPGGMIPNWMANYSTSEMPYHTLSQMRNHLHELLANGKVFEREKK